MRLVLMAGLLVLASAGSRRHHSPSHAHNFTDAKRLEKFVVDATTGIKYNPYSKHHPGRHVCTTQKDVAQPIKTKQSFCKPTFKRYQEKCNSNQLCTGIRLVYETAYRDVVTTKHTKQLAYVCCPGWFQVNNKSNGCNKPHCHKRCQNGGTCVKPDSCQCPAGFSGRYCEFDVDECKEKKPCDQICHNTPGSFTCQCRESFTLQADGQSCRKEDAEEASEVDDLQYGLINKRLEKLETMMDEVNKNKVATKELQNLHQSLDHLSKDVDVIKNNLNKIEEYKDDMQIFKSKLLQLEKRTNKVDELMTRYNKMKMRIF